MTFFLTIHIESRTKISLQYTQFYDLVWHAICMISLRGHRTPLESRPFFWRTPKFGDEIQKISSKYSANFEKFPKFAADLKWGRRTKKFEKPCITVDNPHTEGVVFLKLVANVVGNIKKVENRWFIVY